MHARAITYHCKQAATVSTQWDKLKNYFTGNPDVPGSSHAWMLGLIPGAMARTGYSKYVFGGAVNRAGDPGINAALHDKLPSLATTLEHNPHGVDSFFPGDRTIQVTKPLHEVNSGILAHEIGHAATVGQAGSTLRSMAYSLGPLSALAGSAGVALAKDKETGFDRAMLGTAGSLPRLAEETLASAKGYRMLRELGTTRGKAMGAFIGLPTYLAAASGPLALHHSKALLNGYAPAVQTPIAPAPGVQLD